MPVKTKSIYDPAEEGDGLRVLITRYWPRGIRKDKAHLWIRELGPSKELLREYKDGKRGWDEFRERYEEEYDREGKVEHLHRIKDELGKSRKKNVTLMCACREESHCHRRILKGRFKV